MYGSITGSTFGAAGSCCTSVAVRCELSRLRLQESPLPSFCVDVGVVLSPRNGYVRKVAVDQQLAFLCVHVDQHSITFFPSCRGWSLRNYSQGAGARKTDSQSVGFSLNSTHLGVAKLHVTHSKRRNKPCERAMMKLITPDNLFILNNMAERMGKGFA